MAGDLSLNASSEENYASSEENNASSEENYTSSEENYQVGNIVNHRFLKTTGKIQYLFRLKNYTPDDDTWEPKENLEPKTIEAYERKVINQSKNTVVDIYW